MHFIKEVPNSVFDEDLVDDSTGVIPTLGLGTPLNLRERFIRRLSKLLVADVTIQEDGNKRSMTIFLSRNKASAQPRIELDKELRKFVRAMEDALPTIATESLGTPTQPFHVSR
jgi:hypothetical protein